MSGVILLLGSNIGDSFSILKKANKAIENSIGRIVNASEIYLTEAWGYHDQPAFLNQALWVQTEQEPLRVLKNVNKIEKILGRIRIEKWHERTIDIDIIYYNDQIINEPDLKVPHPELQKRKFVLVPLCEIDAERIHPVLGMTNLELLHKLDDPLKVEKIEIDS
jgi:2-amino-4-hydroxy-6-hydroxymethyldihydropteridine diphosphokinase